MYSGKFNETSRMQRQTASFLMRRFDDAGIRPDTRRGQNFLVDLNLVDLLARSAELTHDDVVLEVGTGTGSLTALLAQEAAHVITVEVDLRLFDLARESLIDYSNVTLLREDALKNKNRLSPLLMEKVEECLAEHPGSSLKLVANLPYNIATPILSNLLTSEPVPKLMVATIQKELADRITARPGTKDFSALSIWIQSQCESEIVRVLPPTVFWPRPKVHSAILKIRPVAEWRERIPDLAFFHQTVRALFFHRRKYLRSVVLSAFKGKLDKPQVDSLLEEVGVRGDLRAEQLSVEQIMQLCETARTRLS